MIKLQRTTSNQRPNDHHFGLTCWYGQPEMMQRAHRHGEVELNLIIRGEVIYVHRDSYVTISAGQLAAFWAAVPHQLIVRSEDCEFYYVTIPIETLLAWELPADFMNTLLCGDLVIEPNGENSSANVELFARWYADLADGRAFIALMEIEARLWRLALAAEKHTPSVSTTLLPCPAIGRNSKSILMARYIIQNYKEPLTVQEIADQVALHPNYAMSSFKQTYGLSILEFVTKYRIAQAQRLLLTTDETVLAIALQSGFESSSNFYAAFKRYVGQSPRTYRRMTTF
ncbi:MAG: AraC family transcriptional regulator [Caldilineaceae bacterium]